MRNIRSLVLGLLLVILSPLGWGEDSFFRVANQHFQTDKKLVTSAWATCVASAQLTGALLASEAPMQSQEYGQQANGAKVALMMTFLSDNLRDDGSNLKQAFETATALSESMPKAQLVSMLSAMESNPDNGMAKHLETQKICNTNIVLQYQQDLIEASRKFRAGFTN